MSDNPDMIDTIVDDMLNEGHTGPADSLEWVQAKMKFYAGRIKAAWKRERAEVEANALSVGGVLGAMMRNKHEGRKAAVGELPHPTAGSGASPSVHETVEVYHNPSNAVNAAAMHEALVKCADIINKFGLAEKVNTPMEVICDIEGIINAALAAPLRNCDVGTAEEQCKRFESFCYQHRNREHGCSDCRLRDAPWCELAWAQMPYEPHEEGGAE